MNKRLISIAVSMALAVLAGSAHAVSDPSSNSSAATDSVLADADFKVSGKIDVAANSYSNDYINCWSDGKPSCSYKSGMITSENYLRGDGAADLNDDLTVIGRLQGGLYVHNTWYDVPNNFRNPSNNSEFYDSKYSPTHPRPYWGEFEEAWAGLRHTKYGTLKLGKGINPRMQALEGSLVTDLGGQEMLHLMLTYESPYLIGQRGNGMKLTYAHYQGEHQRKQIRIYDANDRASMSHVAPTGDSILLDSTWNGRLGVMYAYYRERYAAREFYIGGNLDGSRDAAGNLVPNSGAMTHSHGPALRVSYSFSNGLVGWAISRNQRDKVTMTNPSFPSVGYSSLGNTVWAVGWDGPWVLYAKVTKAKFSMDGNVPSGYSWLPSNFIYDFLNYGGDLSYEIVKDTRLYVGFDYQKRTFYNNPATGNCTSGNTSRPCYSPQGYKITYGVRHTF